MRFLFVPVLAMACAPTAHTYVDDPTDPCDLARGPATIAVNDDGAAVIKWEGEAWAIAVTTPGAHIGAWGRVDRGALFWQVAASDWGGTLRSPVVYGQTPDGASNYTSFGGGLFEELQTGQCYEVHISDRSHGEFSEMQFRW